MHKITIAPDVVAAVKAQRGGRLSRYESLVGPKTALVVIDLQNVFMEPGAPVEVPTAREIVPNVNRLAAAIRDAGGTVAWVRTSLEGQLEAWSVYFNGLPEKVWREMLPGARGYEYYAELDIRSEDLTVIKRRYSAFVQGSSDLDAILRARGIDTVVVVGTLTNVCCESTARDAMMLNYQVVLVSDGNAAINDAEHNAALTTVLRVFGDIASTDEVVGLLAPAPARRAVG